jgi:hypothetical protein
MADDEIERLLREIDATNSSAKPGGSVEKATGGAVAKNDNLPAKSGESGGGRLAFAVVAAVGAGVVTFGVGAFLWLVPFINPSALDMGFGGAIAGFITALLAGPPRWFSS